MFLEKWVKTYLNVEIQVKSQLLYNQHSYSDYQEYLYDTCLELQKNGLGYRKISYVLNDMNLLSVRGTKFTNGHVMSIIKKGTTRKNRIKNLKSHNDFSTIIKDVYMSYEELD